MIETPIFERHCNKPFSIREHYKWLKHGAVAYADRIKNCIREHYKWLKHLLCFLYMCNTIYGIREHYKWLKPKK